MRRKNVSTIRLLNGGKRVIVLLFAVCISFVFLDADAVLGSDSYEPDDTLSQASVISVGNTFQTHEIDPTNDVDWMKFDCVEGYGYVIELVEESGGNVRFALYNEGGDVVVGESDGPVKWTCPVTGTYYLKLWEYYSDDWARYRVRVLPAYWNGTAEWGEDREPDGNSYRAFEVRTDGTVYHYSNDNAGDRDMVRFSAKEGNIYTFALTNELGGNYHFKVYDGGLRDISGNQSSSWTWTCPVTGTYYVTLWEWNDDQVGSFDFSITGSELDYTVDIYAQRVRLYLDPSKGHSDYYLVATSSNCSDSVIWYSDNSSAASVDSTGRVTAHSVGIATVTAMCPVDGSSDEVFVTVYGFPYVTARMSNVDDLATLYINGVERFKAQWGYYDVEPYWYYIGHRPGDSGEIDITPFLWFGSNEVRFTLWNSGCCGVSLDVSVKMDGQEIVSDSFSGSSGEQQIFYDKTFRINFEMNDTDGDNIPGDWELSYGLNPNDPSDAQADYDNDSLSNLEEYLKGTDPRDSDSDDDGMPDGWEDRYGLDPTRVDSFVDLDGDGLANLQEYQYWTDPNNADTDGDGVSDGQEVANGTDPRAISSSLSSNISELDLSIGSTVNVTLTISNKNTTKDTFNLSVTGVDQSWYTLDQSTVLLGAGEDRDILLKLHIPMDCTVAAGDYSVEVSAISPESGPVSNGGASLMLHIVNKPVLSNLYPSDGDTLGTNSVQISWRTDIESSTDVYYRILGETEYTHISGEPGTYHSIRLDDLKWDRVYEWYVESAGTCKTARSENRTFRVQEGVVFENTAPEFQIARDYDQRVLITVRNLDVVAHSVLVAVLNPYDDLIAGFLGSGSQDKSLILDPGKSSVITLAVHAQDSKAHQYYLPFVLTADGETDNPIVDYAVAKISVVDPVFDFSFVEVARDAATLTNTYRLINNGDTITDLNVYAEESAAPNIVFQPRIEHMTIGHGESIEFKATYQAPEGVSQYTGVLTATGAGKTVTISTHFGCEENDSLFYSTLSDTYICLNSSSWYCTNRPNISVTLVTPKGLKREDITRARVYVNYTLTRPRSSYRSHDVTMKFNGAIIQTWRNTIPEGPYAIEVPASLIRTGEDSTGYNKISLETVHMNGGHYAVASDFQLILDVDEFNVGPICATTQEEADQSAQTLPFVCDGTSRWEISPQLESFTVLDSNGTPKWNFNPGDNVQFSITVTNPDLKEKAFNVGVLVDDDFDSGDPPFETGQSVVLGAGKSETLTFGWQIPIDTQAKCYSVKVVLSYSTEWEEETLYPKAVKINQPLTGTVMDNEVEGHGLGGVSVCASWLGEAHLEEICTTTDQDGNFTLLLPEGAYLLRAEKTDFSKDFILVTSFDQPLSFSLSHNSSSLGKAENSGHAEEPVTTSLGNFTLSATDLSFKGRGLNFSFERFYNSQDTYSGPLGHGWTHNYNIKLTQTADVVTIKFADGHEEFYVEQQGGGFKPQPGIHKDLVKNADGTFHLTDKALTTYSFDPSGRLSNITDRNGNTIALNYDNANLVNVTDPVGRNVDFTYDAEGRIVQLTDPINRTVTFKYDSNGDLISVTDPMGFETVYTYDGKHQMTSATNPRGYTFVSNTYDEERRVVTAQSDALGNTSRFSYDDREHITIITDPLGNRTVHRHDNKHRLIEITDAMRNKVLYEYDNDNNRTKVTDRRGSITRITYDDRGNPTQITDPLGNVTTITYDQNDNPLEKIDPLGNTTQFEYDANGNLAKIVDALGNETTIERNQNGQPVRITDVRGNQTEFTYDTKGNLIKKKDPLGFEVSYAYDAVGRRISSTDQLGRTTSYEYDNNDHLIKVTDPSPFGYSVVNTYDENGNLVTMTDRRGNTTSFAYDQKDRLTSISDPLGNAISFTYDALDRRISRTDKRGNTTTYKYDALGRLIEITDPLGSKIKRTYDSEGNVLSEEDNQGNRWSYSYDALNRLITARDPLANEKTYEYDALGRLVKKTDPNGHATEYQYDALGRLVKLIEPGGGETQFTYDPAGNRVRFTNAIGNSFSSEYDDLNRIVRDADGYQYEYDGAGNLISKTDAKGQQIAYAYDELNRLKEIHYPDDSVVSFVYDPNGNLVTMVDPLGTTSRQYDAMNRLTQVTDPFGNTVKYSYDQEGNRSSITYPDNTTVTYEYDEANRLSSVTDWAERTTTYQYNSTGNVAQIILPNGCRATMSYDNARRLVALNNQQADNSVICSYDMTLDKAGNRTAIDKLEPLVPFIKNREVTYQYDSQNQLVSMTDGSFSFDENGSMTAKVSGSRSYNFTWNYDNRLKEWSVGGRTVSYNYDGLRNRITRTEDGNVTRYILDDSTALSNVLAETDANGNITAKYIYGLGLIAREDVQGIHYYHYDPIGSTIALTDATGQVTDKYAYDPFGALANRAGKTENPFAFVGKYGLMDEGEGLYYVRARYYDSELGRFLSRDILFGDPMEPRMLHRYVYVGNDPITFIDMTGLCKGASGVDNLWYRYTGWGEPMESILRDFGSATMGVLDPRVQAFSMGSTLGFFVADTVLNKDEPTNLRNLGPLVKTTFHKTAQFSSLFIGGYGWRVAARSWKKSGLETVKLTWNIAKETPGLALAVGKSFLFTGGSIWKDPSLWIAISKATRRASGVSTQREFERLDKFLIGSSVSMDMVRVPSFYFSNIDYFGPINTVLNMGEGVNEVYSWASWLDQLGLK